jgi:hypothetical protein
VGQEHGLQLGAIPDIELPVEPDSALGRLAADLLDDGRQALGRAGQAPDAVRPGDGPVRPPDDDAVGGGIEYLPRPGADV